MGSDFEHAPCEDLDDEDQGIEIDYGGLGIDQKVHHVFWSDNDISQYDLDILYHICKLDNDH